MPDNILITTVVSLDVDGGAAQLVIHLVQGDYGTRAIRFVPVSGGKLIDFESAGIVAAKVRLSCEEEEDLLINCTVGDNCATMIPTAAMVNEANEWTGQLVLLDENNQSVTTDPPFTLIVHGTVYEGDAVEHTNSRVTSVSYDSQGRIVIEQLNGNTITNSSNEYLYEAIETALASNLLSEQDRTDFTTIKGYLDQSVKKEATPKFDGLQIGGTWDSVHEEWTGGVKINGDGTIEGAVFT